MARLLEWFVISSTSGPRFVRTLHYDLSILVGPAWHGTQLHWVTQALHHNEAVIHEGGKDMHSYLSSAKLLIFFVVAVVFSSWMRGVWGRKVLEFNFPQQITAFCWGQLCLTSHTQSSPNFFFFWNLISYFWVFLNVFIFNWRIIKMPNSNFHILLSFSLV